MSLPASTTISGIDSVEILEQNLEIARNFHPMSAEEMDALRRRCSAVASDGRLEKFKTTMFYDGDVGREQHGFPSAKELPL
jgi:hypothetical protein